MAVPTESVSKNQRTPFSAHREELRLTVSVHSVPINLPPRLYKSQPGVSFSFGHPGHEHRAPPGARGAAWLILNANRRRNYFFSIPP